MNILKNIVALILCGASIGWMIGLSVTPVIQGILTTIFSFIIVVLGLIAGVESTDKFKVGNYIKNINLLPVGIFFLFLSIGAAVGIYTRTNDYLGVDTDRYFVRWKIDTTDRDKMDSLKILLMNNPQSGSHLYDTDMEKNDIIISEKSNDKNENKK
jgi:ATP/ADP translocase